MRWNNPSQMRKGYKQVKKRQINRTKEVVSFITFPVSCFDTSSEVIASPSFMNTCALNLASSFHHVGDYLGHVMGINVSVRFLHPAELARLQRGDSCFLRRSC